MKYKKKLIQSGRSQIQWYSNLKPDRGAAVSGSGRNSSAENIPDREQQEQFL